MKTGRVLVAPLNWGLGHATRCIPIIRELCKKQCEVFIASDGDALKLLMKEFPELKCHELPSYNPVYPDRGSMMITLLLQLPKFIRTIRKEHREIERLIRLEKIDVVISDNRYGAWSDIARCIFTTHQVNILLPKRFQWLRFVSGYFNSKLINKFSSLWIPDIPGSVLSGEMTTANKLHRNRRRYIGLLSRFTGFPESLNRYDVVAVLSGPEPQRSKLEEILKEQFHNCDLRILLVRGVIDSQEIRHESQLELVDYLPSIGLNDVMGNSALVIARSGYSTIMDLARLGKKAILIPTPGQPEQEYLADRLMNEGIALAVHQDLFDFEKDLERSKTFSGFIGFESADKLLESAIEEVLQ